MNRIGTESVVLVLKKKCLDKLQRCRSEIEISIRRDRVHRCNLVCVLPASRLKFKLFAFIYWDKDSNRGTWIKPYRNRGPRFWPHVCVRIGPKDCSLQLHDYNPKSSTRVRKGWDDSFYIRCDRVLLVDSRSRQTDRLTEQARHQSGTADRTGIHGQQMTSGENKLS
jgi:hypothetical protein